LHGEISFNPLLLIVVLALIVPIMVEKIGFLKIPVVVGEIFAGIIIGKSGLNIIQPDPTLDFLSTFGFTYLMFLSGLEIDFDSISASTYKSKDSWWRSPAVLGSAVFVLTLISSLMFSYILFTFGLKIHIFLMALILSTTSLGVVVPILKESGIASSRWGQSILFSALIADFITMLLITALVTFITPGASHDVLLVIVLFVAFYILYRVVKFITHKKLLEGIAGEMAQIQIRGAFALILVFIVLSHQLGVEIILGAFLAGALISMITHRGSILHEKLEAIGYGFFVPIFFVMVGVQFDLPALLKGDVSLAIIVLLLAGAYFVKFVPALIFKIQYSWKEVFAAGALLSSRLSLIIAASAIGLKIGVIDNATNSAIILVAIITVSISPILFRKIYSPKKVTARQLFIFGASEPAYLLANKLQNNGYDVSIVDERKRKPGKVLNKDVKWIEVDWQDPLALNNIHPEKAETVVIASPEDDLNKNLALQLVHQYQITNIVCLISNPEMAAYLKEEGVRTVSPKLSTFLMLKNLVVHPRAFELLLEDDNVYINEVELKNNNLHLKTLQEIRFPGNCLVISILRGEEKIFPYAKRKLKLGDKIVLIGDKQSVEESIEMLSGK